VDFNRLGEKGFLRPFVIAALALTLIAPAAVGKERKGAEVIVTKKDGTVVQGELLAVRGVDLILKVGASQGVTESLKEIGTITIVKKGGFGRGAGKGFLYGGLGGAVLAVALTEANAGNDPTLKGASAALVGGLCIGAIGALVGGIAGTVSGSDRVIVVETTDADYLARLAVELRPRARDRG